MCAERRILDALPRHGKLDLRSDAPDAEADAVRSFPAPGVRLLDGPHLHHIPVNLDLDFGRLHVEVGPPLDTNLFADMETVGRINDALDGQHGRSVTVLALPNSGPFS